MVSYFLVKSVSKATAENEHFAGDVQTRVYGKDDFTIYCKGSYQGWYDIDWRTPGMIEEHGYKRLCDAKRNYAYRHPENSEFWKTTVEILQADIDEKGKITWTACTMN